MLLETNQAVKKILNAQISIIILVKEGKCKLQFVSLIELQEEVYLIAVICKGRVRLKLERIHCFFNEILLIPFKQVDLNLASLDSLLKFPSPLLDLTNTLENILDFLAFPVKFS